MVSRLMKIPCKDCITLAACKNRRLDELTKKCCLLDAFIEVNSIRHTPKGIRLTKTDALQEVFRVVTRRYYHEDTL